MSSIESVHSESDSESDSEFKIVKCDECESEGRKVFTEKCSNCQKIYCEGACSLKLHTIGCEKDQEKLCLNCFVEIYKGKNQYCREEFCKMCWNKPSRYINRYEAQQSIVKKRFKKFKEHFNVDKVAAWKANHPAINYPGRHTGRYLIDLVMSENDFEAGYYKWLIEQKKTQPNSNCSRGQSENFAMYIAEAEELDRIIQSMPVSNYNLRAKPY